MGFGGTSPEPQPPITPNSNDESQTQILSDINTNIRFLVNNLTGRTAPAGGIKSPVQQGISGGAF